MYLFHVVPRFSRCFNKHNVEFVCLALAFLGRHLSVERIILRLVRILISTSFNNRHEMQEDTTANFLFPETLIRPLWSQDLCEPKAIRGTNCASTIYICFQKYADQIVIFYCIFSLNSAALQGERDHNEHPHFYKAHVTTENKNHIWV